MRNRVAWIIMFVMLWTGIVSAQGGITGITTTGLNLRDAPEGQVVGVLGENTTLAIEGRNMGGNWLRVHTQDNALTGWVAARFVALQSGDVAGLPVVDESAAAPPANTAPVAVSGELTGLAVVNLNVRVTPETRAAKVGLLTAGTTVNLLGRNQRGNWLYISGGGLQGWIAGGYLRLPPGVATSSLPVVNPQTSVVTAPAAPQTPQSPGNGSSAPPPLPDVAVPDSSSTGYIVLPEGAAANARAIFQRGQSLGNSPNTFIKIGDSNMTWSEYLCPFNSGSYDLGSYSYLQGVISAFQPSGSFCANHNSAQPGFVSNAVVDAFFVINPQCQVNETPIACDIRLYRPSFALLYLGVLDMNYVTPEAFAMNIDNIVAYLSDRGVVPILSTFTIDDWRQDGRASSFNDAIRRVAAGRQVPLIDVQAALFSYPQRGTGEDGYHLARRDGNFTAFNGDENTYGRVRRELLTLQMLDALYGRVR
jgi:uncharacterized protein YraI